jgi:predicted RND superfamily exporter protein
LYLFVELVIKLRLLVIACIILSTLVLGSAAYRVRIDIDRKTQLPQSHPLIRIENQITQVFGGARIVGIAVIPKQGGIFQPAVLAKIQRITDAVESMPGVVRSNVLSITAQRAKAIRGTADAMEVQQLMGDIPDSPEAIQELRDRIASQPFYTPLIVSKNGDAAAILADFREGTDTFLLNTVIHKKLSEIIAREADDTAEIHISGMPIWLSYLDQFAHEMPLYLLIAIIIIGLIHYEAFRTIQAMLLPLVTALLSVIWSLGWLGLSGLPMDTWNSMTPILVLAVAAGHAVQILKRYYEEYEKIGDNHAAIVEAVVKVGHAMIFAGVAASIGFASLALFEIRTIRVFGLITAAGILSALVIEMTFIPAIRSLLPPPKSGRARESQLSFLDRLIKWISATVLARPKTILAIGIAISILSMLGSLKLVVNNSFNAAMPQGHPYRIAEGAINRFLGGANTMSILIDSNQIDGIKRPDVLRAMNKLQAFLNNEPWVGTTQSIADYIKRINQAMHGDNPSYYKIPEDQSMVGQYLFMYSLSGGTDDFDMVVDKDYQKAVIRVFAKNDDHVFIKNLFQKTASEASRIFPSDIKVSVAGGTLGVAYGLNETIVRQKMINVGQILLIIFLFGSYVFRSPVAGLYILIPSTLAMLVNWGVMGITGIPLSLGTATTSALTVSIGADYAIYVLYRFHEEARSVGDIRGQVERVLLSTGKAVFYVSSAIAAGYAILIFTGLLYYRQLGGLVSSSMVLSSLAAVTLLPAMLLRFQPKFLTRSSQEQMNKPYKIIATGDSTYEKQ